MNFSTGIKSREAAIEAIDKSLSPIDSGKYDALTAAQKENYDDQMALDNIAVNIAITRINSLPQDVSVINATIRTNAGRNELINIHIAKH